MTVFHKTGMLIEQIAATERWTANVSFGRKDHTTLFATASTGLYSIQTKNAGDNTAK